VWSLIAPLAAQDEEEAPPPELVATGTALLTIDGSEHVIPMGETVFGPLFALGPVVRQLGGEIRSGPGGSTILRLHDVESILGPGSAMLTRGRTIVRLSQPVHSGADGVLVPQDLLEQTLGQAMGYDFLWSPTDRRLYVMSRRQPEVEVGWDLVHIQGISTLVLTFPERPRHRIDQEGRRIVIHMLGGEQVTPRRAPRVDDPLLQDLEIGRDRIVLTTRPDVVAEQYEQSNPFRLVFDFYRRQEPTAGEIEVPRDAPALSVIVVDPGHGGGETGATGPSGVYEKELSLTLARLLRRRLEARLPVRVILTRDEDADLPLDTRTAMANQNRADLFVSIHLNSSLGQSAHGAETYFLSLEASDPRAAAAATEENRAGDGDPALDDLQLILWDLAQSRHLAESQSFATLVQDELNQALGLRDRGVKQAPFRVLMGAAMPAVLVELGFLSNPEEEAKLVQPAYQQELVDALVRAVARYRAQVERSEAP
jgi:N-acetylmuramoyl-L-alanine amidase